MAGSPSSDASAPPATSRTSLPSAVSPTIQPSMNARPFTRARGVASISTMAMIGIGLIAMTMPNGRTSPMASFMAAIVRSRAGGVRLTHAA